MSKSHEKLECSANEYFWLQVELAKARQNLQKSIFLVAGTWKDNQQAYIILIKFYQKALEAFSVRPGSQVTQPVVLSRQFLADLKTLDTDELIDVRMTRRAERASEA